MRASLYRSIVWAVDPLDEEVLPSTRTVMALAQTALRARLELVVAHVVMDPGRIRETGVMPELPEAQAALDRMVARYPLPLEPRTRVLADSSGTHAGAVRLLLDLAAEEDAEWIAVSTHGRGGVKRLVLGSFAEELVARSPLPVFFLPHEAEGGVGDGIPAALFPTDLSAAAHATLRRFLPLCARQGHELLIYHALSYPVPAMDFGLGPVGLGPVLPAHFLEEQESWARAAGARLVEEAGRAGVRARFLLDTSLSAPIHGEGVVAVALRERAGLVVMPTLIGPVSRLLNGSVAQEVFRAGKVPVLLYGPSAVGPVAVSAA